MPAMQWLHQQRVAGGFLGFLVLGAGFSPALAGDSLYGKVTEVKDATVVTLDYGAGTYVVRITGIEAPREGKFAQDAREVVAKLVLGKTIHLRFEGRNDKGEMVGQVFTDDPEVGVKDVGLELMKSGLVRRIQGYDYKYHELSAAESEARKGHRGLWAATPPK
ncbi:MAG: thermonuclease family protein [Acidobacteriota bacterium]